MIAVACAWDGLLRRAGMFALIVEGALGTTSGTTEQEKEQLSGS